MFEAGITSYPIAPSGPIAYNVHSDTYYTNFTSTLADNSNVQALLADRRISHAEKLHIAEIAEATCIIVRTYSLGKSTFTEAIGTGVLINESQIITAAHCCEDLPGTVLYIAFGYLTKDSQTPLFQISDKIFHSTKDIALITLQGQPGLRFQPSVIQYASQPLGEYWVAHHAGGLPAQLSVGRIPDLGGGYFQYEQEIIVHAGSGASGAGVFDSRNNNIIGIIYYLSMGFGRVSRKLIRFHDIRPWIDRYADNVSYNDATRYPIQISIPKLTLPIGQSLPIVIDISRLEEPSPEAITWRKMTRVYIPQLRRFLSELDAYVNKNYKNKIPPPEIPAILSYGVRFDTHQVQHHYNTRRKDKTIFAKSIGQNAQFALIQALGALVQFLQRIVFLRFSKTERDAITYYAPPLSGVARHITFAFRLSFNVAEIDRGDTPCEILYMESGTEIAPFHFYPERDHMAYSVDYLTHKKMNNAHIFDVEKIFSAIEQKA